VVRIPHSKIPSFPIPSFPIAPCYFPRVRVAIAAVALVASAAVLSGQATLDGRTEVLLAELFPAATSFSPKLGNPPHYEVYGAGPARSPVALAFWTTDLDPLERGYDGPIKILVGLDMRGVVAGVIVADHHEPYGYFSVDTPEFAEQFKGKSVRDAFRVGGDVQAISRATLTVSSATRAIRNSARRIATALVPPVPRN
jgi:NosR/NirI family transcriptional regulator, nitrous oxide reductase regulator